MITLAGAQVFPNLRDLLRPDGIPVVSNGKPFTDTLWLRLTDMFIFTSLLLICVCSAVVAIAKFRR